MNIFSQSNSGISNEQQNTQETIQTSISENTTQNSQICIQPELSEYLNSNAQENIQIINFPITIPIQTNNSEMSCDMTWNANIPNEILSQMNIGIISTQNNNNIEPFGVENIPKTNEISFKKINSNKLYYGLACNYIKDDCFYDALKQSGYTMTDKLDQACLIVPCSYETTENEINDLVANGIAYNKFSDAVRIFMLNNTDLMVSKLALWKYLKEKYGSDLAAYMLPHTWDLTDNNEVELFKKQYNKNKLYITKNNYQRQEGLEIHSSLDTILKSRDKYILVQELLQDPYLISGRKINLRVYVLVINDKYSNMKIQVYNNGFMYYTSELFKPNDPSFKKNITTGYIDRQVYVENPLTHMDFRTWLDSDRNLTLLEQYLKQSYPNIKLSEYIFSQIYEQLGFVFKTYENIIGNKNLGVSFQLYGVDVAINQNLSPMLMEINKGPDLTAKDGRDKELKVTMCADILKSVGLSSNVDNGFITVLENVNVNGEIFKLRNLVEN